MMHDDTTTDTDEILTTRTHSDVYSLRQRRDEVTQHRGSRGEDQHRRTMIAQPSGRGALDPWSAQSVLRNASAQLVALVIADGSHGSDLGGWGNPRPDPRADSAPLVAARAAQLSLLREWLRQVDGYDDDDVVSDRGGIRGGLHDA